MILYVNTFARQANTSSDLPRLVAGGRYTVVYKVPESQTQVKVQISYQKKTLVEVEVTVQNIT